MPFNEFGKVPAERGAKAGAFERLDEQRNAKIERMKDDVASIATRLKEHLASMQKELLDGRFAEYEDDINRRTANDFLSTLDQVAAGQEVGIRAGAYMRALVLGSTIRPPHTEKNETAETNAKERRSSTTIHAELDKQLRLHEKQIDDPVTAYFPDVVNGNERLQSAIFRARIPGTSFTLAEQVNHFVRRAEIKTGLAVSIQDISTYLTLRRKDGALLHLNDLLPDDVHLAPMYMKTPLIATASLVESKNLSNYNGFENMPVGSIMKTAFFNTEIAGVKTKTVTYGNLAEPGGMLTLLHETAHAWQEAHGHMRKKYNFNAFEIILDTLFRLDKLASKSALKQDPEAYSNEFMLAVNALRERLGIDFWEILPSSEELGKGDVMYMIRPLSKTIHEGKKEKLNEILREAVLEERDAWAIAIRTLRFLRRQEFNLEPTLRNQSDIEAVVYRSLDSYQYYLDKIIKRGGQYAYTRKRGSP
ncbi:MAG: hypothetical protein AAB947_01760 [Patescibacteria group bacterium]